MIAKPLFFDKLARFWKFLRRNFPQLKMFWSMTGFAANSSLETLLDRDAYTLEEVLDEESLLTEVKSFNKRLLNFLQNAEQVRKMIHFVISKPPDGADEKRIFKYSFVSCAVIACEIDAILKAIVDDEQMLDLLFSFLQPEHDHGSLLAGYFSKVVVCLLLRKTEQTLNYIQNHRDILSRLVELIGITSIMEVLIRIVDIDDNRYTWNFQNSAAEQWLADTELLELLIEKLSPENTPEEQANAASVLCAVTGMQQPALGSKLSGFVGRLFHQALENVNSKSAVVHSLSVCISLLDPKKGSLAERDAEPQVPQPAPTNGDALDNMLHKIGDILNLLDVSNDETILPTTYGKLRPPLGIHRLKVVEFMGALLKADMEKVGPVLVERNTLQTLLDLFFDYPFNNMLHHQVESIISLILERNNSVLIENLLKDCDLVTRILSADRCPYDTRAKYTLDAKMPPRIGNIGHITRIANKLTVAENQNAQVYGYLQTNMDWLDWRLTTLQERNAVENVYQWACGRPMPMEDRRMDSDEDDFRDRDYDVSTLASNVSHEVFRYGVFDNPDGEEDVFFDDDSAELVMHSLRLSDEQESARLFGDHSSWFAFQEEASNGPLSSAMDPDDQLIRFSMAGSGSSSSDDDEVVVGADYDVVDTAATSSKIEDKANRDENDGSQALHTVTIVDITSELKEVELTEDSDTKGNDDDGESCQFDGGTRAESTEGRVFEVDMVPETRNGSLHGEVESLRDVKQLQGIEPEGTAKAMERALKEGVVGEAAPLHHQTVKPSKVSSEDDAISPEMGDVNYWKSDYDQSMIAEVEKL